MVFQRQFSVRLLQFIFCSSSFDLKNFIIFGTFDHDEQPKTIEI